LPIHLNGISAATGRYATPALSVADVAGLARGRKLDQAELQIHAARQAASADTLGVAFGVDPEDLSQAGWAVVFADDADPAIRAALSPLLDKRRAEAGDERFRVLDGPSGVRSGEACRTFLARHGAGPGPADVFPYYVLLVGDPERVPYRFQFELDASYAVGRIAFDGVEAYGRYARSVVAAEEAAPRAQRRAVLFGTRHPDDDATEGSASLLVTPLANALAGKAGPGWSLERVVGDGGANAPAATRDTLAKLLSSDPPSLLFTAGHGMVFPRDDPRLADQQGALLCQDWPGPVQHQGAVPEAWYVSAANVPEGADLRGLVAFLFACYGAGTPRHDDFAPSGAPPELAPRALLAGLPRRLLSVEGGALAVVGHVERAWSCSFEWPGAGAQTVAFRSALEAILAGRRLGAAMEYFAMRLTDLSLELATVLQDAQAGKTIDDLALADLWTSHNDARNYVIVGDPAVRVR
jgi:hypothetical protein